MSSVCSAGPGDAVLGVLGTRGHFFVNSLSLSCLGTCKRLLRDVEVSVQGELGVNPVPKSTG